MGTVLRAFDERLEREVAIKLVRRASGSDEATRRLEREARVAAGLDHPGVVRIFELGVHEGETYIVMELVRGAPLSAVLRERGPASIGAAAAAGVAIARATAVAHDAGIVHRDLKPQNVVVRDDGVIKVLDFGLAKSLSGEEAKLSATGTVSGTPAYLSPELLAGSDPSAATDVWALGVLLMEIATDSLPFPAGSLSQLLLAIVSQRPDLGRLGESPLRPVLERVLCERGERRVTTMWQFEALLAPLANEAELRVWGAPLSSKLREVNGVSSFDATVAAMTSLPRSTSGTDVEVRASSTSGSVDSPSTRPAAVRSAEAGPALRASAVRALDDGVLDELAELMASFPEPLAELATSVEVARADGDATGVRKRLFELGIGVVRYAVSVALAVIAARVGKESAPRGVAEAVRKAARLSDGQWCDLARVLATALRTIDPAAHAALGFLSKKSLAELVAARNDFIHRSGVGNDALTATMAVLESAAPLLGFDVRVVASIDPSAYEARAGSPLRSGVWKKTRGAVPAHAAIGAAYLHFAERDEWIAMSPWLPLVDRKLLLIDAPHGVGKPWRSLDPETGEQRDHGELDEALKRLVGSDAQGPQALSERPALVGMTVAIQAMRKAAEQASRGGVRVVLVTGPFGIGRTRALETLREAAASFGFGRALDLVCSSERRGPLRALKRALAETSDLAAVKSAVNRAVMVDPLGSPDGFGALLEAVEDAMIDASLEAPLLLTIDDAQWADEQTLTLVRLLTEQAARRARGKLLIVAAVRDEPNPSATLRRLVGQVEADVGSGAERVGIAPLPEADAARLVRGVGPVDSSIERAVVSGAGGVPYFLVQPLLVWNETGALTWKEGAWSPTTPEVLTSASPGVRDLVRARLSSYFDPGSEAERAAQHALACVALYGSGLTSERIVATTGAVGLDAMAVEQALESLVASGLLVVRGDDQEYGFAQGVVQAASLDDLRSRPWFRRVHRALLDGLAASDKDHSDAAFLARGYGKLGVHAEAHAWAQKAVSRATATGSFDEAVEIADRLAEGAPTPSSRAAAHLLAVDALLRSGRTEDARARLDFSGAAVDPNLAIEARVLRVRIGNVLRDLPGDHDGRLVEDADLTGQAAMRVEARLAMSALVRGPKGTALADEALALVPADRLDLRYRAFAERLARLDEVASPDAKERRALAEHALAIARAIGSISAEIEAENNLAVIEFRAGRVAEASVAFERLARRAKELGLRTQEREALSNGSRCHSRLKNFDAAAALALEACASARAARDGRVLSVALLALCKAEEARDNLDAARAASEEAAELALVQRDYTAMLALMSRAELRARTGHIEGAIADAESARALAVEANDEDMVMRAGLRRALFRVEECAPDAESELTALLDSSGSSTRWREATKRVIAEAEALRDGLSRPR